MIECSGITAPTQGACHRIPTGAPGHAAAGMREKPTGGLKAEARALTRARDSVGTVALMVGPQPQVRSQSRGSAAGALRDSPATAGWSSGPKVWPAATG